MGWGNPTPLADLKRNHAAVQRLERERDRLRADNERLTREVEHEQRLHRRFWRELWQAVHDRNDAPDYYFIDQSSLICAIQDADTVDLARARESEAGTGDRAEPR